MNKDKWISYNKALTALYQLEEIRSPEWGAKRFTTEDIETLLKDLAKELPYPEEENPKVNTGKTSSWRSLGHRMGYGKHPWSIDYKCKLCGYEQYTVLMPPPEYCPHCGAYMEEYELENG